MTTADLAAACARHGWVLERDGDGWTLLGNGAPAAFRSTESLAVWLAKQEEGKMGVPKQMPAIAASKQMGAIERGVQSLRYRENYTMTKKLKAPMPYVGGKSDMAAAIWVRLGDCPNYVEPMCGSAAVLLGRPHDLQGKTETVNDIDSMIINMYRAIMFDPDTTAEWCDFPVSEADLTARHLHLKAARPELTSRIFADPFYFDPILAAFYLYGAASWIGDGWCVADGPWIAVDGRLVDRRVVGSEEAGVRRKMPQVSAADAGVNGHENLLGINKYRAGVPRKMPEIGRSPNGQMTFNRKGVQAYRHHEGVPRKMPMVSVGGGDDSNRKAMQNGVNRYEPSALAAYFARLADRLRRVRFLCGDWRRCVKDSVTVNHGLTAVFMDSPYPKAEHSMGYHSENDEDVWFASAAWAAEHGDDRRLRIAVCGYMSPACDAMFPPTWERLPWEARGGYANQSKDGRGRTNAKREMIWFSPHCIDAKTDYGPLFAELEEAA